MLVTPRQLELLVKSQSREKKPNCFYQQIFKRKKDQRVWCVCWREFLFFFFFVYLKIAHSRLVQRWSHSHFVYARSHPYKHLYICIWMYTYMSVCISIEMENLWCDSRPVPTCIPLPLCSSPLVHRHRSFRNHSFCASLVFPESILNFFFFFFPVFLLHISFLAWILHFNSNKKEK